MKGVLERNWDKISQQTLDNIKLTIFKIFFDKSASIRSMVANVITTLFLRLPHNHWTEIISFLETNLEQNVQEIVETSLESIGKIFEDLKMNTENMNFNSNDNPFSKVIMKLMLMCDAQYPQKIKERSLHCLNTFIQFMNQEFLNNYLNILFSNSQDQDPSLRQKSCEGFLDLYELKKMFTLQYLDQILETMLKLTLDQSPNVKKIACRFWSEYLLVSKNESLDRIHHLKSILYL